MTNPTRQWAGGRSGSGWTSPACCGCSCRHCPRRERATAGLSCSPSSPKSSEFRAARAEMDKAIDRETKLGHPLPRKLEVGAMLETPHWPLRRMFFSKKSISSRSAATTSSSSSLPPTAKTSGYANAMTRSISVSCRFWKRWSGAALHQVHLCLFVVKMQGDRLKRFVLRHLGCIRCRCVRPLSGQSNICCVALI